MTRRILILLPLIVLLAFVAAVLWRLGNPPDQVIRSKLAGQPIPTFALPGIMPGKQGLNSADLATGRPRLVNIFASWCVPCIAEAPVLMGLKQRGIAIDAVAVRDRSEDVAEFLARHGDPFDRIGSDSASRVQLALGSAGVPESFVVDGRGIIRYQHVGPIMPEDVDTIMTEMEDAR